MRASLAVAALLLKELTRKPSSFVVLALIGLAGYALPRMAAEAGSLRARLQVAVTYGIGLPAMLVGFSVLIIAAGTVARDFETRRIQTVLSKPCAAWELILGRLLGIAVACAAPLALLLAAFALNVTLLWSDGTVPPGERDTAFHRFFTPRLATAPAEIADAPRSGDREEAISDAGDATHHRIPPGAALDLTFRDVPAGGIRGPGEEAILSYAVHWSPPGGSPQTDLVFELRSDGARTAVAKGASEPLVRRERVSYGVPHELAFPASLISPSRTLSIRVSNPAGGEGRLVLVRAGDVRLLTAHGGFWPQVLRSFALLHAQLVVLAAVGLLGSSLFSFGTGLLLGFFVYVTGLAAGFLQETFEHQTSGVARTFLQWVSASMASAGRAILGALPHAGGLEPVDRLAAARAMPGAELVAELGWILLVEAGLVVIATSWLLSRREAAGSSEA